MKAVTISIVSAVACISVLAGGYLAFKLLAREPRTVEYAEKALQREIDAMNAAAGYEKYDIRAIHDIRNGILQFEIYVSDGYKVECVDQDEFGFDIFYDEDEGKWSSHLTG